MATQNVLSSEQLAASPVADKVLTTDGDVNAWAAPAAIFGKRTYVASYPDAQVGGVAQIVTGRAFADETLTTANFANQIDYPRTVSVTAQNLNISTNMTGTVTLNGTDADGATIQEVVTVNVSPSTTTTYETDLAFILLTTIVTDKTDAHVGDQYSVGVTQDWGVPNYPLAAAGDAFKATVDGVNSGITAVDTTNGVVNIVAAIVAPGEIVIFYNSAS